MTGFFVLQKTRELFAEPAMPAGFRFDADFIGAAEEERIVRAVKTLDFAPYEHRGVSARRRVVAFGYQHDYQPRRLKTAEPFPAFLDELRSKAAVLAGVGAEDFEQALVSEY